MAAHDLIADEKLVKRKADIDEEFLDRIKTVRIDKDPSEPLVRIVSCFDTDMISRPFRSILSCPDEDRPIRVPSRG